MQVVEVMWVDAFVDTDDFPIKKAKKLKPVPRTTVGYLVEENDDCVVLCTDTYPKSKKMISTPMVIPNTWIVDMWVYEDCEC